MENYSTNRAVANTLFTFGLKQFLRMDTKRAKAIKKVRPAATIMKEEN